MPSSNWDEIRTAFHVALSGTVSGAAEALGVHHATVIRHIDALETRIGVKLFQRHARGYTPTEAGEDLLKVGKTTDEQINQLISRIRGRGNEVQGDLVITTLSGFSDLFLPVVAAFQKAFPAVSVRYLTGARLFRLEYGEAHVAIRAGAAPQEPDNVVQPLMARTMRMMAAEPYLRRHGLPRPGEWEGHAFIGYDGDGLMPPYFRWLRGAVPESQVVFRATEMAALERAVVEGIGIGPVAAWTAATREGLTEVMEPLPEWETRFWLVTHVDLHRTTKVQAFLNFLKDAAREWPV